ncbi:hypothetical protein T261_8429 [Streptomyces lydicus]|nr:hypothetical protein T261_8429 [Streptomyces lydicus]
MLEPDTACRHRQLASLRHEFTETGRPSGQGRMTCRGLLAELLMAEYGDRTRRICR